jgi:hypothetical protein
MTSPAPNNKNSQQYHRAESPATSIKSRKSLTSRSNHNQTQKNLATAPQHKNHDTSESSGEEYFSNVQNDKQEADGGLEIKPDEESELPPPNPVIPTHQWQCEHCTYVNRAGTRVCAICCKTPTGLPQRLSTDSQQQQQRRRSRRNNSDTSRTTNSLNTQARGQKNTSSGTSLRRGSVKSTNSRSDADYKDTGGSRQWHHNEFTAKRELQPTSDDYSDIPYDEGYVLAQFNKQLRITHKSDKSVDAEEDPYEGVQLRSSDVESTNSKRKGRPSRKISFWPGTKFPQKC